MNMKAELRDATSNELPHTLGMMKDPCIIWAKSVEGKSEPLCTIERDEFYSTYLRAAETFYDVTAKDKATLSFEFNHTAGLGDVPAWRDISAKITEGFLSTLVERGVSPEVRALVQTNLNIENSLLQFSRLAAEKFGATPFHTEITNAHEVASVAHAKDSFARPQDTNGLFHIPYMQHPRNIAIYALQLNLSPSSVIVALLHDVVEDSHQPQDITLANLKRNFDDEVTDGVMRLTRSPVQSRAQFLEHVGQLTGELAVVKGLDRYDNLIRAFGIQDSAYHARLLDECRLVYDPIFQREDALKPLYENYELLKRELGRYTS